VGGLEALKLGQLEDIWRLATGIEEELDAITDKYIKGFAKSVLNKIHEGMVDPGERVDHLAGAYTRPRFSST